MKQFTAAISLAITLAFAVTASPAGSADELREPVPSHHSPLFKIDPEPSVILGVEATVIALMELMGQ